jgi:hypothetical protein
MRKSSILVFALLIALAGCKPARTIVGNWQVAVVGAPPAMQWNSTFNADRTFVQTIKTTLPAGMPGVQGSPQMTMASTGTWTSDNKSLTLTTNDISVTGLPPELEKMAQTQFDQQKGRVVTDSLTWKSDDQFECSSANGTATYTRVKS